MSSTRPIARAVVLTIGVLVLAPACGGGAGVTAEKDAVSPIELGDGDATTPAPPTTRSGGVNTAKGIVGGLIPPFTLDDTVWFSGFKIKLSTATVDAEDKILTIEGEGENDGPTDRSLFEDIRLEQDGVGVANGRINSKTTVQAGSRNGVTIRIDRLPATFDPDKAVLVFGDAKHQQPRVPLKGNGPAVTGEPQVVPAPASIKAGGLLVTIDKLSVRGDDPKGHSQAPIESQYVVLEGSVRFDGVTTNVQSQDMSLIPPKGAAQSPAYLNALPRRNASDKVFLVFEMPSPLGGDYNLQIKGDFVYTDSRQAPDGPVTVDTKISIPAYPPAPTTGS